MPNGHMIEGETSRYYSARLIVLVVAIAMAVSGVTSAIATYFISKDATKVACVGRRSLVRESNKRAPFHQLDATNLENLATRLSTTRAEETKVWSGLERILPKPFNRSAGALVKTLGDAKAADDVIAESERGVHFNLLKEPKC